MTYHKLMSDIDYREALEEMYKMGRRHGFFSGLLIGSIIGSVIIGIGLILRH